MELTHAANPLVSVVLPSHNHRHFVKDAIRSVYQQTYRPIELIIIDDGSRDGSAAIILDFLNREPPPCDISVDFSARRNRGAHATLNEGIEKARGQYVAILNSDDLYVPERIDVCLAAARERNSRLVLTYVEPIDGAGQLLDPPHPWLTWYHEAQLHEIDLAPSVGFTLLAYNIAVTTGNLFFRRDLYDEIGPFEDYRYAHDLDFLMKALVVEEPVLLRRSFYKYRIHETNTNSLAKPEDIISELEQVYRRYFMATLTTPSRNTIAPTFSNWPSCTNSIFTASTTALNRALDSFLETPKTGTPLIEDHIAPGQRSQQPPAAAVALISHELSRTGAPTLALEAARMLVAAGAKVNVISLSDGPLRREFERARISVKIMLPAFRRDTATGRFLAELSQVVRHIDRWGIIRFVVLNLASLRMLLRIRHLHDCILINSFASWPLALKIIKYYRRARIYWYIHETINPYAMLRRQADQLSFMSARRKPNLAFLFGSDGTRRVWASHGCDGQVRYWSGLSSVMKLQASRTRAAGQQSRRGRRTVLSVGTSSPRKGTRTLIEAFAQGRSRGLIDDDVELVVVGCVPPSGHPLARDLIVRVHQPDLYGRVRLVGTVEAGALHAYYAEASVYVQSSTMECLPLALLMAMAYRLPIVTTDVDGCAEAILNEVCGLTVPPRDIANLANAIGRMLADPAEAHRFGDAARERFERVFSLEATANPLLRSIFPDGSVVLPDAAATVEPAVAPSEASSIQDRDPGQTSGPSLGNRAAADAHWRVSAK
jgi:glycosyltransferase involved in cell wall biosynthesis